MKRKILIIDDDETIVSIITKILEFENYEVNGISEFNQYSDILDQTGNGDYDLVIIDYMLKILNGFELHDQLQKLPGCAGKPFILLTSVNLSNEISSQVISKKMEYIKKPFNHTTLLRTIRKSMVKQNENSEDTF